MALDATTKATLEAALVAAAATTICPICGTDGLELLPGVLLIPLQPDAKELSLAGAQSPMCLRGCRNCGYVAMHCMGILDPWLKRDLRTNTPDHPWD